MKAEELKVIEGLSTLDKLNESAKKALSDYLVKALKNPRVYNKMASEAMRDQSLTESQKRGLSQLRSITHKLSDLESKGQIVDKAESHWKKVESGEPVEEHEKLTLAELRSLKDIAGLSEILRPLIKAGIDPGSLFTKTLKKAEKAGHIITALNAQLRFKEGDIIIYDLDKEAALKSGHRDLVDKIMRSKSVHGHTAQIVMSDKGAPMISHMADKIRADTFSIIGASYSTVFRIDPVLLLSKAEQDSLTEDQKNRIKEEFKRQIRMQHSKVSKSKASNPFGGQVRAFVADLLPFGHTKLRADTKSQQLGQHTGMLCSEYVGRATMTALSGVQAAYPKLKFASLVGSREDISTMLPSRFAQLLMTSGACEVVELPPRVSAFVTTQDPNQQTLFHSRQKVLNSNPVQALMLHKEEFKSQLRKLTENLPSESQKQVNEIIKYVDKLAFEKRYKAVYKIINMFKNVLRVKQTERVLVSKIQAAHEMIKLAVATEQQKAIQRAREQYLGKEVATSHKQLQEAVQASLDRVPKSLQSPAVKPAQLLKEKQAAEEARRDERRAIRAAQSFRARKGQKRAAEKNIGVMPPSGSRGRG